MRLAGRTLLPINGRDQGAYPTQKQFADAILTFLRETLPKEWTAFRERVSDNFRVTSHDGFRILE